MKQLLIGLGLSLLAGCTSIAYQYEPAPTEFDGIWYMRLMGSNQFLVLRPDGTGIECVEGGGDPVIFDAVINGNDLYVNAHMTLTRKSEDTVILDDGFFKYELKKVPHASAKCNPYLG